MVEADMTAHLNAAGQLATLLDRLDRQICGLQSASRIGKNNHALRVLDAARPVLQHEDGLPALRQRAGLMDEAGLFSGTDWGRPTHLLPNLVKHTLTQASQQTITLEAMSLAARTGPGRGATPRAKCAHTGY